MFNFDSMHRYGLRQYSFDSPYKTSPQVKISLFLSLFLIVTELSPLSFAQESDTQSIPSQTRKIAARGASLTGDLTELLQLAQTTAKVNQSFKSFSLNITGAPGIGRVNTKFFQRKLPAAEAVFMKNGRATKDTIVPALFKGHAWLNRSGGDTRRVNAALSIIKGEAKLRFALKFSPTQAKAPRIYTISWKLSSSLQPRPKITTRTNGALRESSCASEDRHSTVKAKDHDGFKIQATKLKEPVIKTTETRRILTISTQGDQEWYRKYGDASNAEIAATINAAEAIFDRQLGVRFALVRQHIYVNNSPYTTTDASQLLAAFAKNPENPAIMGFSPLTFDEDVDLKELFTGKNLDGNTIGLSYVGAVCWSSKNAYGLTQDLSREMNIVTFAHEIGHTLGASHDTVDPNGIMYPTLGIKDRFSEFSIGQMRQQLASTGQCLAEQTLAPNLANATLTLKRKIIEKGRGLVLSGKLTSNTSQPIAGEIIRISVNQRAYLVQTDSRGVFRHQIALAKYRGKKLTLFAETAKSETAIAGALKVNPA